MLNEKLSFYSKAGQNNYLRKTLEIFFFGKFKARKRFIKLTTDKRNRFDPFDNWLFQECFFHEKRMSGDKGKYPFVIKMVN